jgi:collagen type V/XI/XXIV/XXVII alpha
MSIIFLFYMRNPRLSCLLLASIFSSQNYCRVEGCWKETGVLDWGRLGSPGAVGGFEEGAHLARSEPGSSGGLAPSGDSAFPGPSRSAEPGILGCSEGGRGQGRGGGRKRPERRSGRPGPPASLGKLREIAPGPPGRRAPASTPGAGGEGARGGGGARGGFRAAPGKIAALGGLGGGSRTRWAPAGHLGAGEGSSPGRGGASAAPLLLGSRPRPCLRPAGGRGSSSRPPPRA